EGVGITGTSEVVHYVAVSHVWGSSTSTHEVCCNGRPFWIQSSLVTVFEHLVPEEGNLYLWVDAICINQSNAAEKAAQVRNIMRIFEKAKEVIGWIDHAPLSCSLLPIAADPSALLKVRHGPGCQAALASLKGVLYVL